jgi:hypothetical protein
VNLLDSLIRAENLTREERAAAREAWGISWLARLPSNTGNSLTGWGGRRVGRMPVNLTVRPNPPDHARGREMANPSPAKGAKWSTFQVKSSPALAFRAQWAMTAS